MFLESKLEVEREANMEEREQRSLALADFELAFREVVEESLKKDIAPSAIREKCLVLQDRFLGPLNEKERKFYQTLPERYLRRCLAIAEQERELHHDFQLRDLDLIETIKTPAEFIFYTRTKKAPKGEIEMQNCGGYHLLMFHNNEDFNNYNGDEKSRLLGFHRRQEHSFEFFSDFHDIVAVRLNNSNNLSKILDHEDAHFVFWSLLGEPLILTDSWKSFFLHDKAKQRELPFAAVDYSLTKSLSGLVDDEEKWIKLEALVKDEILAMARAGQVDWLNFDLMSERLKPNDERDASVFSDINNRIKVKIIEALRHCKDKRGRIAFSYHCADLPLRKLSEYLDKLNEFYTSHHTDFDVD